MLTLALGIGVTTAVFSVVNSVLLKPLPYPDSGQLIAVAEGGKSGGDINVASPNFIDIHDQSHSFSALAAYASGPSTVLGANDPVRVNVASVTTDFFPVMRVQPTRGRVFTPAETEAGGNRTAVVSYDFWRDHLGGTQDLGAHNLSVDGSSYQIVGVMPQGFDFPDHSQVWTPQSVADGSTRTAHNWQALGRLRDGVSLAQARSELGVIYARLKNRYGSQMDATDFRAQTLQRKLVGSVERPLILVLSASVLVLLVACTNLASTLLAAGTARRGELAVRAALGAQQRRILRQLSTEGLLLAMIGSVVGLALAALLLRVFLSIAPSDSLPQIATTTLDGRVIGFAIVAGIVAAVLSSLFPAVRISADSVGGQLAARGASERKTHAWSVLVATEVALALLLLVGAGLVGRSFWKLLAVDPGFNGSGVVTAEVALPEATFANDTALRAFYQELLPNLTAVSGVKQAGVSSVIPLSGGAINGAFDIEGRAPGSGYADYAVATGGYFRALRIPLEQGRLLDDQLDRAGTPGVAVVNRAFASRYWPGQNVIGKRMRNFTVDEAEFVGGKWVPVAGADQWVTIVGVVGDVRNTSMTEQAKPIAYLDLFQRPYRSRYAFVALQGSAPPAQLADALRSALTRRGVPAEISTMDALTSSSVASRKFSTSILGFFAVAALILAAIGIYGVVSYQVAQRTREMGIRMALGAQQSQVWRLVMRRSMRVVAVGLAVGVLATLPLTRVLQSLLYGIGPADPITFVAVLLLFGSVAVLASLIPAFRATRVDPVLALRNE